MAENKIFAKINKNDTNLFAELSCDFNPIHVDEAYAKRTLYKNPICHGLYICLKALDILHIKPIGFEAKFIEIIYVNDQFEIVKEESSIKIYNKNDLAVEIILKKDLKLDDNIDIDNISFTETFINNSPLERTLKSDYKKNGKIKYLDKKKLSNRLFPWLSSKIGSKAITEYSLLSYMVGMEYPGLNSLYCSISVLLKNQTIENYLFYSIYDVSRLSSLVRMYFKGNFIVGRTSSILLKRNYEQSPFTKYLNILPEKSSDNLKALIVGGNTGIGETVVKICSAMGIKTTFTYNNDFDSAKKIINEITKSSSNKISVYAKKLNILSKDFFENENYNLIFYFASPRIAKRVIGKDFSYQILEKYNKFYIDGFKKIYKNTKSEAIKQLYFYPSSIFIDKKPRGFEEYIESKILGENLCNAMKEKDNAKIKIERLPPLATNQTITPLNYKKLTKVEDVMINLVKDMINDL